MAMSNRRGTRPFRWLVSKPVTDGIKARESAIHVAPNDSDVAEIKAILLVIKWMVVFVLAFFAAITCIVEMYRHIR